MQKKSSTALLVLAGVVFGVGIVALIALFVMPAVDDGGTAPTWVYLLAMCTPIGFLLGIVYALRSGRRVK